MSLLTPAEEFAITVGAKLTMPSKSLLQGATYTHSTRTDLKERFEAMKVPDFNDDAANAAYAQKYRQRMRA